jgi:demethylmenaquinone methyltransferase / 2-methoxy-6-polyprenyl-1,4-benzoquinol methylase
MFGEIAGRYDLLNHVLSLNTDRYWRWRTVRETRPEVEGPILDVCTGTGDLALAYLRRYSDRAIVAADFCHPMLVRGRQKGERAGAGSRLVFLEADAQALPFPDERFALVTVAFGLRNVSDTRQGLAEMARVLRPGGRLGVLEFSLPRRWPLRPIYGWYFGRVLPRIGRALASNENQAYDYLPSSVREFPSGEALGALMSSVGLVDLEYRPLTAGIATLYLARKPRSAANGRGPHPTL